MTDSIQTQAEITETIAKLNDACRKQVLSQPNSVKNTRHIITQGIAAMSVQDQLAIAIRVSAFDNFSEDNDPYQERDFGAFDYQGQKIFWKIDYYDQSLERGSEDPSDPEKTIRVLTILLASEY